MCQQLCVVFGPFHLKFVSSLQVQKLKGSAAVVVSEDEIEVIEENIPVTVPKVNKFLQPARFFKLSKGDSGQLKSQQSGPFFGQVKKTPAVASHGHPAVRGRGFTPPHFQEPVTFPTPPIAPTHGRGHGRGRGAGHMQVKTPYMPPPMKTTEQVKKPKKGTSMLQDFDPQLKAQLAHSISASVTSLLMSMLGVGWQGLKGDLTLKNTCWL